MFIIDGQKIVKVKNADAKDADSEAYIPTLCMNYGEFEQRNLYTRSFYETYNVGSLDDISFATEGRVEMQQDWPPAYPGWSWG